MSVVYTGNPTTPGPHSAVTVTNPQDTDPLSGESNNDAIRALADHVAFLHASALLRDVPFPGDLMGGVITMNPTSKFRSLAGSGGLTVVNDQVRSDKDFAALSGGRYRVVSPVTDFVYVTADELHIESTASQPTKFIAPSGIVVANATSTTNRYFAKARVPAGAIVQAVHIMGSSLLSDVDLYSIDYSSGSPVQTHRMTSFGAWDADFASAGVTTLTLPGSGPWTAPMNGQVIFSFLGSASAEFYGMKFDFKAEMLSHQL